MRIFSLLLFSCWMLINPLMAQQNSPDAKDLLNRLAEKGKSIQQVTFDFSYRIQNEELDEVQSGKASVSGAKYRIKLGENTLVCDGEYRYTILGMDATELQINCLESEDDANSFLDPKTLLNPKIEDFNYQLLANETHKDKAVKVVKLKPKTTNPSYDYLELLIDEDKMEVVMARIFTEDGTKYFFEISQLNTAPALQQTLFQIDEGTFDDVIDLRDDC
ncbi:MAG: outer membrane lipoprotein carrier protein LolA [Salibacteraceae bacterium]